MVNFLILLIKTTFLKKKIFLLIKGNFIFYHYKFIFIKRFAFYDGFSGVTLYDPFIFQLFNMFYAAMPIIIYALIDEEFSCEFLVNNPKKYVQGIKNSLFNTSTFWLWIFFGIWQSMIITIFSYLIMENTFIDPETGYFFNLIRKIKRNF